MFHNKIKPKQEEEMDNRRQTSTAPKKTYRKSYYRQNDEKSYGYGSGGYKPRHKNSDSSKKNKYGKGENNYRKRNNKYNSKKRFNKRGKSTPHWKKNKLPRIVSDMQITDGKHRGKYLKTTESPKVRPTARRIRETMFRILYRRIRAKRFLDICAGSGTVGLEAISRGALISTFVERKAKMCSFIRKNMERLEIKEGHGEVYEMEVVPFLKEMKKRRRFWDVVYYDPPYDTDYDQVLKYFEKGVCLKPGGVLVIEHHAEMFFAERIGVLKRWRVVVQGESAISFYDRVS